MPRPKKPSSPSTPEAVIAAAESMLAATVQDEQAFKNLLIEKMKRDTEALRIYEPMPHQEAMHSCRVPRVIMQKGNRVGGTTSLAVEIARAVTGQDPYNKYPKTNGIACCLGYGEGHIGRVFHRLLFRPGAFDMIRDLETQRWRAYRPWPMAEGGDLERDAQKRPAPPLIPKRFLDGEIVWDKKGERVFKLVRFTTGWELYAFNSAGDPSQAQGFDVHLYAVDEDTAETGWIEESFGRLSKTRGLFRWTALPHGKNDEMMQMLEVAEKESESPNPQTVVLRSTIFDNKYLPKDSVESAIKGWKAQGEDVYRKRALGELSLGSVRMYPSFNRRVHDVMNSTAVQTEAQKILVERLGEPPDDWTRYAVVDPGHQICAVLFIAIPPPALGDQLFVYDELYIPEATARHFGEGMEIKCRDRTFEEFIIDMHGGKLTSIASGEQPVDKYAEQLKDRGITSERTGHNFRHGCDEIKRREDILRTRLAIQNNSAPGTMVVVGRCSNLTREMEKFRKKTIRQAGKDVVIEAGDRRAGTHAVECWEMGVSSELIYVKPRDKAVKEEWIDYVLRTDKHREEVRKAKGRAFGGGGHISLGPIGAQ